MSERNAILEANQQYSQTFGAKGTLPLPPARSLETAVLGSDGFKDVGEGPGSQAGSFINWLTIGDLRQSVVDDVRRIREHPLVPARIPIDGFIYQVETGKLVEIEEASAIGAA